MELTRHVKYESDLNRKFTEELAQIEGCEKIWNCIQCGTCSGTCPLSIYMDFTPRRLVAMAREGFEMDVLKSFTIWLCSSCYSCTVMCPREIRITDLMYAFKRMAIEKGIYTKKFPTPVLAKEFHESVLNLGRNPESLIFMKMAMKSDPTILLRFVKTGWNLMKTGRLSFGTDQIKGSRDLRKLLASLKEVKR
jgi:heterodisulfide reductase subunit C